MHATRIRIMPIYEYGCESCSATFEVLTSFAERERAQSCPHCESRKTRVKVSSFAAVGLGGDEMGVAGSTGGGCACGGSCSCGGH